MFTVFPIQLDLERSKGSYVHDRTTKADFLDFYSFYSSLPLGYNHPIFGEDFNNEIQSIAKHRLATNVFKIDAMMEFQELLKPFVFSSYMHFTCTGALAVEAAIKCALFEKKYKSPLILSVTNSFHGVNSWGFITDRKGFTEKRMEFFPRNNWKNLPLEEIIRGLENDSFAELAAIVIEPIQCTAGDLYLDPVLLKRLRTLTLEKNICLIFDEIQTGFGTTGTFWYYEQLDLVPDILIFGKKSQVCGIVASEKYSECITSPLMKLHVTFDGEVMDAIRAKYVLKAYREDRLISKAKEREKDFFSLLNSKVKNLRMRGHLIAFDLNSPEERDLFLKKAYQNHFLCNSAGSQSIRMRPNLALSEKELSHFKEVFNKIISF
jgi:L-lysine 6-transaminase